MIYLVSQDSMSLAFPMGLDIVCLLYIEVVWCNTDWKSKRKKEGERERGGEQDREMGHGISLWNHLQFLSWGLVNECD